MRPIAERERAKGLKTLVVVLSLMWLLVVSLLVVGYFVALSSGRAVKTDIINSGLFSSIITIIIASLGINVAIGTFLPLFYGKSIVRDMADDEFKKSAKDFASSIDELEAIDSHSSRMFAALLHMADMPLWSMGWAARALIRYIYARKNEYSLLEDDFIIFTRMILVKSIFKIVNGSETIIDGKNESNLADHIFQRFRLGEYDIRSNDHSVAIRTCKDLIVFRIKIDDRLIDGSDPICKELENMINVIVKTLISTKYTKIGNTGSKNIYSIDDVLDLVNKQNYKKHNISKAQVSGIVHGCGKISLRKSVQLLTDSPEVRQ